jgi:YcxB-like protein
MKINYILNSEDLIIFFKKTLKENSFIFKNYVFAIAIIAGVFLSFEKPTETSHYIDGVLVSVVKANFFIDVALNSIILIALIFLMRYVNIHKVRNTIAKNLSLTGERDIEVVNDMIILKSLDSETEIKLSAVKKIKQVRDHYFIYTDKQVAIIVPKRALASDELIKKLCETIKMNVC